MPEESYVERHELDLSPKPPTAEDIHAHRSMNSNCCLKLYGMRKADLLSRLCDVAVRLNLEFEVRHRTIPSTVEFKVTKNRLAVDNFHELCLQAIQKGANQVAVGYQTIYNLLECDGKTCVRMILYCAFYEDGEEVHVDL